MRRSTLDHVGKTPLVPLRRLAEGLAMAVAGKGYRRIFVPPDKMSIDPWEEMR